MGTWNALVDPDIQPAEILRDAVTPAIDLEFDEPDTESSLIDALSGKEVLFTTSRLSVTERVLADTELEVIAKLGTGIDNVDLDAARDHDVTVTHTPGMNALSVAEHTVTLLLGIARRVGETQELLSDGNWRDTAPQGTLLSGKTIGIFGYGNIGRRVAKLLTGFNVQTLAHDPYVHEVESELTDTDIVSIERLLEESQMICVNAALTEETRGTFDEAAFNAMRDRVLLVNTARGPLVDTDALIDALQSGKVAGAGLDVFETEPLPADSKLHELDNVITTPHVAAMTEEYRERGITTLARNTLILLDNGSVDNEFLAVAPEVR
ncbi:NAD(P)-dependent oxidoreductase [Natronosalvus caseinilyticus]|uniref:NAD(P)-dependent oxidoreductase n=1 Tax=Natronosalvus caseinilyticus TaxID=2953747 RepID=UPI0028ABB34E|nr:NAD(P)-dependent oxidoreductase [Natronosalvus caseinilyticus]